MATQDFVDPRVQKLWSDLETIDARSSLELGETIVPETLTRNDSSERRRKELLQGHLGEDRDLDLSRGYHILATIGEGGMGLVRLANQAALRREVAVKTVRPDRLEDATVDSLLRESLITGRLEHPNIIPVHTLSTTDEGPMLVMKHVEGVSWAETLLDPDRMPPRFQAGRDLFEAHLHILLAVCDALHFAHNKGIIHRDLKPDNVMLGNFGEVYVLDWGLAVSMNPDDEGILPLVSEIDTVAGTPHYMAPEMVVADPEGIGPRTDTYLLGAILHEILTDTPRHQAKGFPAIFIEAYRSAPVEYHHDVPAELGAIANRATAADPDERFPDTESFRLAIANYLRHRDSYRLTQTANRRLGELQEAIDQWFADPDQDESARDQIYLLFAPCRFGFEQALDIWSDNMRAQRGRRAALQTMADFELRQEDEKAASLLINELSPPDPELLERLEALQELLSARDSRVQRLQRIEHAVDINLASRERAIMAAILGIVWGAVPATHAALIRMGFIALDYTTYFIQFFGPLSLAAIVVFTMRRRIIANAATLRIIQAIFVNLAANFLARFCIWLIGGPITTAIAIENVIAAFCIALIATLLDRRIWAASLVFAAAAIGVALAPNFALEISALANTFGLFAVAVLWWLRSPAHQAKR